MMGRELSRRATELAERGEPFATATVVRAQRPTSANAGDAALVLADGTIEGFVGGDCAEHSVRVYALRAIETGEPVLLRITPFGDSPMPLAPSGWCGHGVTVSPSSKSGHSSAVGIR